MVHCCNWTGCKLMDGKLYSDCCSISLCDNGDGKLFAECNIIFRHLQAINIFDSRSVCWFYRLTISILCAKKEYPNKTRGKKKARMCATETRPYLPSIICVWWLIRCWPPRARVSLQQPHEQVGKMKKKKTNNQKKCQKKYNKFSNTKVLSFARGICCCCCYCCFNSFSIALLLNCPLSLTLFLPVSLSLFLCHCWILVLPETLISNRIYLLHVSWISSIERELSNISHGR